MNLCKEVMRDEKKRKGFDSLINKTFKLSFLKWYDHNEWGEWNQPYTLFEGEKAVANITVNHMKVLYQGRVREYIQLGGVATAPEYRGQGLSRMIMNEVKKDWKDKCDAMILLANRNVVKFYPRFGFVEEIQYQYSYKIDAKKCDKEKAGKVYKLDLAKTEDKELLSRCYKKRNPYSEFQFINNFSLLQFYCYYGMDKNLYYIEELDALVVAEYEQNKLLCYDVYCVETVNLLSVMNYLLKDTVSEVVFLFTPVDKNNMTVEKYADDDTHLFVLEDKENVFSKGKLYVPDISHT